MKKGRVFSEVELKEMGTRTRDLIDKAIDAGEFEKAKRLNHRMYAEWLSLHDLYRDWVTGLLSFIYKHYGIEVLYEALKESCAPWAKPMFERYEKESDFRQRVEMFAMGLRGHLQPIDVMEDDEKVCLIMRPCGSGERLIKEGAYGPPKNFSTIKEPHLTTWGNPNFPIYCAHTPLLEILAMERGGYPPFVCYAPEDIRAGGCRFCLYKDPKAIPEWFYTRVEKERPQV